MAKKQQDHKTNAMRIVMAANVPYDLHFFECEGVPSGVEVARLCGQDPDHVFKTLVTQGKSGEYYVFLVPVAEGLNLKKAANAVGEKAIAMIKQRELLPLTGYVHGGCSPLGMKKQFVTCVDETALLFDSIIFSGGRVGCQIEVSPDDLARMLPVKYIDLCM